MTNEDRPLFLLGPLAATLRWLEELANLLSGPLLVAGLAIALIDLLTDGQLLTAVPALLYAWAIAQAIGVDAQLVGAWDRAKRAMLRRQWWALVGLVALGCVLAYVAYVAGLVFATQEAHHISEAQALASLHMDATTWLWQRVGVSVFLVCLSGFTRYRAPKQTTLEDERAKLQRELELEPLRQRVRGLRLAGVRDAAATLVGNRTAATSVEPPDTPTPTPDEPQAAVLSSDDTTDVQPPDDSPAPAQTQPPDEPPSPPDPTAPVPFRRSARRRAGTGRTPSELRSIAARSRAEALEAQAFSVLDRNPGMKTPELRKVLGCANQRARELHRAWQIARANHSRQA